MQLKRGYIWIVAFALVGVISLFFDRTILSILTYFQAPFLNSFFSLFEPYTLFILLILGLLGLFIYKKDKKSTIALILTIIITILGVLFLKLLFARERPFELIDYLPFTQIRDYSFPSSHTAIMFALVPFLIKEIKKLKCFWIILAIMVGYSRIYLGAHYLSDVIFGGLIGVLIGTYLLKDKNKVKHKPKKRNKKKL